MPKVKRTPMHAAELMKEGWKVVADSLGSTTYGYALSPKEVEEMKRANVKPGFLSSGSSVFSFPLFRIGNAKPAESVPSTHSVIEKKQK